MEIWGFKTWVANWDQGKMFEPSHSLVLSLKRDDFKTNCLNLIVEKY